MNFRQAEMHSAQGTLVSLRVQGQLSLQASPTSVMTTYAVVHKRLLERSCSNSGWLIAVFASKGKPSSRGA
ncbi:hypothetical protein VDGE_30162 [Verticillium dahliae]|uniref:Uncharacterized protein n=1 Tax=Verticillium dahliae TaxID=27337 RepID=A0A444S0H3_VERDA|nr:hypothetical protein VDGE_30162 [Verticillium dahliae]